MKFSILCINDVVWVNLTEYDLLRCNKRKWPYLLFLGCGPSSFEENQCGSVGRGRRLLKKRVTFSYVLRVICESQESCLEWLKNQGFIPKVMSCPNCSRKMKFEKHESALDGYVWVCKVRSIGYFCCVSWFLYSLLLYNMVIFGWFFEMGTPKTQWWVSCCIL